MAVGDGAKATVHSYVALSRETTYGTYASATTAVECLSLGFRTDIKSEKIPALSRSRDYVRRVQLEKEVKGSLEQYAHSRESVLLFGNALGGPLVTTSLTGGYIHSISAGNFDTSTAILGLSFNVRKGDTHVWRYLGGKVNTLKLSAEVGAPIKVSYDFIFADSTQLSDDISATLSYSSILPFTFVGGEFRYSNSETAAGTSTVAEPIQGFELTINNNLKDKEGRKLGSRIIGVLPATRREIELTITQRWDTTTTWTRFIQATQGSVELVMTGDALTGATNSSLFKIRMPQVFNNSPEPELKSDGDILSSEISFDVMADPSATTQRAIGLTVQNGVATY